MLIICEYPAIVAVKRIIGSEYICFSSSFNALLSTYLHLTNMSFPLMFKYIQESPLQSRKSAAI